ncbi:hypothetical protein Lal_00018441 [Lupinus albus]|nr:hypothetical protein Lal_00018441 [Lupinus albus]
MRSKYPINHIKAPKITEVIWQPPNLGWIKVNTNGGAHGAPGQAGGGIFRDHKGSFLACFVAYYGIQDALFVEFHYVILAIKFAHKEGWNVIWLECDSTLVVDIFSAKLWIQLWLLSMWSLCQALIPIMSLKVSHI